MRHIHLVVIGMGCRRCVREVTGLVRDIPGVQTVSANARDCTLHLSGSMQLADVLAAFAGTTYVPRPAQAAINPSADAPAGTSAGASGGGGDGRPPDDRNETAVSKPSP